MISATRIGFGSRPPAAAPGGSSSESARAGVEQYCSAIHPGKLHQVGRHAGAHHRGGLGQALGSQLGLGGQGENDPQRGLAPERDAQHRADAHLALLGAQPVVERPTHGTGAGQGLHPRDRWARACKVGVHRGTGG